MNTVDIVAKILETHINPLLARGARPGTAPPTISRAGANGIAQIIIRAINTARNAIGSPEAERDVNSMLMRQVVALLTKRAGGRLLFGPEELREFEEMIAAGGADLDFTLSDDGALEFTLKQVSQAPGLRLS